MLKQGRFRIDMIVYGNFEPREGEPRPPHKAYEGLLGATGLGCSCLGSDGLHDS